MSKKILVVDDEEGLRKILTKILAWESYQVLTANNGDEAIEKIKKQTVDLLITDIRMPVKDGSELLKVVSTFNPILKVIILTGYPLSPYLEEKVTAGTYVYIAKPFDNLELLSKVNQIIAS